MFCDFDIYQKDQSLLKENRRHLDKEGHKGVIHEIGISEGMNFGYYKIDSESEGSVLIKNKHAFFQLSHTISGRRSYVVEGHFHFIASSKAQEYNHLLLGPQQILLKWDPGETLEIFEIGISPELITQLLPENHPIYPVFNRGLTGDGSCSMSDYNMLLRPGTARILYDMLHCPLEGYYKQLYLRSKTTELLAVELEEYEQRDALAKQGLGARGGLKKQEVERMYHARNIVLSNMHSPCSLIDLAHQVGTNDAYLKKHFKEVFGTTVFGYLHVVKMREARKLLLEGETVSEVAFLTGYKHVAHFTRAFKKHFGVAPNKIRK